MTATFLESFTEKMLSYDRDRIQTLKGDMNGVLIFVRSYFVLEIIGLVTLMRVIGGDWLV
jgi:hypothetical protein